MQNKKTIAICTDHSTLKTGFSKFKRSLLRYLYKTGKYNLIEFSNGVQHGAPELSKMPWQCFSTSPTPEQQARINSVSDHGLRESLQRQANYGKEAIPLLLRENKVDVFIQSQDSWGIDFLTNVPEVKNTTFIPHCTIDSRNLLASQIDLASSVDNLYVWASFAIDEYAKHGINNVKYLSGCVETDNFFPLPQNEKRELKKSFGLGDNFVISYVFRNQTRKSIPNILDGFKLFQEKNPTAKGKLLLVTSAQEGWNIQDLAKQRNIKNEDIILCYYCRACRHFELKPFFGHDQNCPNCKSEKTFNTVNIIHGISEESLNEVYNCSDVYLAAQNSGGLEIPAAIEAKCAGVPVLCTNYSCGEDIVKSGRGGIPLDFSIHYEYPTGFAKASTCPNSICDKLTQVYLMPGWERDEIGCQGRQYVLNNLSPEAIGKQFEEIFDSAPFANWENWIPKLKNPQYVPADNLSNSDWIINLYKNMLNDRCDKNTSYIQHWTAHLDKTGDRQGTLKHFQNVAAQQNNQVTQKTIDFSELLDPTDEKRLLVTMPESAGDVLMVSSIIPQIKNLYPEFRLYFATSPQFKELVEHLPEIHRILDFMPVMEDIFLMTGKNDHKGYFDIVMLPHGATQRFMTYQWRREAFRAEWL